MEWSNNNNRIQEKSHRYSYGGQMITAIAILAVAVLLWLILKPFILLYIEKENEKHDKSNR